MKVNNTIYLLNTNPRPPKRGARSNTFDLHFLLGDQPFEVEYGRTYCMPTGVRMFSATTASNSSDLIVVPRSSSSLLRKSNEREHLVVMPNNSTHTVKSYYNLNLRITNTVGYIDWEYRNDIQVRFTVDGLEPGEVFLLDPTKPYVQIYPKDGNSCLVVVESLKDIPDFCKETSLRGEAGFGSTDR